MSLKYGSGDIILSEAEVIVNPVNCVGVAGAGLALHFKNKFPDNYEFYRAACASRNMNIGKVLFYKYGKKKIINFPTKTHWKLPSKLEYIQTGLHNLREVIQEEKIKSIAVPALGCGLGGLNWDVVKHMIDHTLSPIVELYLYEPWVSE